MDKIQAIFLDRDVTIGEDNGDGFKLYDGTEKAIGILKQYEVLIYAFTNQPGKARGECKEQPFRDEFKTFGFDGSYICPHGHWEGCECRKPNTGMLEKAKKEHGLDLVRCVVVGDRWSDMFAAARVGATKILVKSGAWEEAYGRFRHKWSDYEADYIADDILDAVKWLDKEGYLGD
jgi:histidinol-phosphate phosphatase family protein